MLFNILHAHERLAMLNEAWRVLAAGGKLAVIHWSYDPSTPRLAFDCWSSTAG